ncbi:MAG TPA: two-component system response regulator [Streptomyces sp.]|nr:two-component system response regulator [Streptomyces sp.]
MIAVLVVDDDVRVAAVNAAYVGRIPGFHVTGRAHSAREALAFLEREPSVDLVLLDHYLPDGSGLALMRRLRELGRQTDVIMVTAARDLSTVQSAMRNGALQYLVKPFGFAGLRAKLEGYAALRQVLDGGGEAGQGRVDRIFGAFGGASAGPAEMPKGHSTLTADRVREVLRSAEGALSAQQVAERSGISRQTAQRYLKLLERAGRVRMSLRYGETGRPEHRYAWDGA